MVAMASGSLSPIRRPTGEEPVAGFGGAETAAPPAGRARTPPVKRVVALRPGRNC